MCCCFQTYTKSLCYKDEHCLRKVVYPERTNRKMLSGTTIVVLIRKNKKTNETPSNQHRSSTPRHHPHLLQGAATRRAARKGLDAVLLALAQGQEARLEGEQRTPKGRTLCLASVGSARIDYRQGGLRSHCPHCKAHGIGRHSREPPPHSGNHCAGVWHPRAVARR